MNNSNPLVDRFIENYRSYKNLPPLAGLASFPSAIKQGLSVDESVTRLKRHYYAFKRLNEILIARITGEPIYELKMAFSYHSYLCAENTTILGKRVGEMREPPLGLDKIPHPALEVFFDEILCSPSVEELLVGIYQVTIPALEEALKRHKDESHVLADQPSRRICQQALHDIQEMKTYGDQALACLVEKEKTKDAETFKNRLQDILAIAEGLDGTKPVEKKSKATRVFSKKGFVYDGVPKRDERLPDPFNMGVNAETFLYDEKQPADAKVLMMFFKRLREIDVPEMMASILYQTKGKPWEYTHDMTRQLWDEARHAMMGEVGFVSLGLDWSRLVRVNHTWSLSLNTQLKPKERHSVLYYIEQGLMPKTGKRFEWEVATMAENPLSATFQDFDWADEVLHAQIGRDWYVADMPSPKEAVEYGDQCWNRVLINWNAFRDEGLTQHSNWWPELYKAYCKNVGKKPDPKVASYSETYEKVRPDLKQIAASA